MKDITTKEKLKEYLYPPFPSDSFPTEHDGRYLVARVYSRDPTIGKLNWCRSLDHVLSIRVACRNLRVATIRTSETTNAEAEDISALSIGLPTTKFLFDKLWPMLPDFIRAKVTRWAKLKMEGPIAYEIREYVKQFLLILPLSIPAFFVNSMAHVVIPPLVQHILRALDPVGPVSLLSITTRLINRIQAFPS